MQRASFIQFCCWLHAEFSQPVSCRWVCGLFWIFTFTHSNVVVHLPAPISAITAFVYAFRWRPLNQNVNVFVILLDLKIASGSVKLFCLLLMDRWVVHRARQLLLLSKNLSFLQSACSPGRSVAPAIITYHFNFFWRRSVSQLSLCPWFP